MNVIPLFKDRSEINTKVNSLAVDIPPMWWTTNYTLKFSVKQNVKVYKIQSVKSTDKLSLPKTPGWDGLKGDYRVKESNYKKNNYIYYRDLKIKLLKYSPFPVVLGTIIFVYTLLNFLSKV